MGHPRGRAPTDPRCGRRCGPAWPGSSSVASGPAWPPGRSPGCPFRRRRVRRRTGWPGPARPALPGSAPARRAPPDPSPPARPAPVRDGSTARPHPGRPRASAHWRVGSAGCRWPDRGGPSTGRGRDGAARPPGPPPRVPSAVRPRGLTSGWLPSWTDVPWPSGCPSRWPWPLERQPWSSPLGRRPWPWPASLRVWPGRPESFGAPMGPELECRPYATIVSGGSSEGKRPRNR